MTSIVLALDSGRAGPVLPDGLRRLLSRIAALRRRRHYPSIRLRRARAVERWAADCIRHR